MDRFFQISGGAMTSASQQKDMKDSESKSFPFKLNGDFMNQRKEKRGEDEFDAKTYKLGGLNQTTVME